MKRYFFGLRDGGHEPDLIGTPLCDDELARQEAIRFIGEVVKREPHRLTAGPLVVEVSDQNRNVLFEVEVTVKGVRERRRVDALKAVSAGENALADAGQSDIRYIGTFCVDRSDTIRMAAAMRPTTVDTRFASELRRGVERRGFVTVGID